MTSVRPSRIEAAVRALKNVGETIFAVDMSPNGSARILTQPVAPRADSPDIGEEIAALAASFEN